MTRSFCRYSTCAIFTAQSAICTTQSAICTTQSAICTTQSAICTTQSAIRIVRHQIKDGCHLYTCYCERPKFGECRLSPVNVNIHIVMSPVKVDILQFRSFTVTYS
ncbi:hypothetical protein AVEN_147177-1 [Araneus ventricosus]|uniref:Uncharacterized protein n=1 Tax=Araneus ventricosus TaxID=182803 RepID=A0A4Y2FLU8_ARAVE|nr:hypothetical protein AVEN_147177-1 [Araneus ventricosus]